MRMWRRVTNPRRLSTLEIVETVGTLQPFSLVTQASSDLVNSDTAATGAGQVVIASNSFTPA